jgi:AraC family transcriptional activator of tynA and feaB
VEDQQVGDVQQAGIAPTMSVIPGGVRGFQSAITANFFPYVVHSVQAPDAFHSAAAAGRIGALRLSRTHVGNSFAGGKLRAKRGEERNAYVLMVVEDGVVHLRGKRNVVARSGDLVLLNADHALETQQETPGHSLAVSIPAPMLRLHYAELDEWCLLPMPTTDGSSALLRDCLTAYWKSHAGLGGPVYNDLAMAMIHLIGACFRQRSPCAQIDSRSIKAHFLRVRAYVEEHLTDPDLCAESIAAALGISRSYLFMVMNAADTTLGRFVLEQRLQRASQMLGDPGVQCRTISEIAFSLGFQDLSHFSRRFTGRFGRSPRAYRAGAQAVLSVA